MTDQILAEVFAEMRRARELHGDGYMGNLQQIATWPDWTLDNAIAVGEASRERLEEGRVSKFDVLMEEVGELAADIKDGKEARKELVQVAAMSLAWLGVDPSDTARPQLRAHLEGHRIVVDTPVELQMTNDGFWDGESLTLTVGPGSVPIECTVQLPSTQKYEAGESQCG